MYRIREIREKKKEKKQEQIERTPLEVCSQWPALKGLLHLGPSASHGLMIVYLHEETSSVMTKFMSLNLSTAPRQLNSRLRLWRRRQRRSIVEMRDTTRAEMRANILYLQANNNNNNNKTDGSDNSLKIELSKII